MNATMKWLLVGGTIVGAIFAIIFGIFAANTAGGAGSSHDNYVAAAATCGVIAGGSLIALIVMAILKR